MGIVGRTGNLTALALGDTGRFAWTAATIAGGGAVAFGKPAVRVGIEALKRQRLARWAGKAIRFLVISKARNFGLVLAEDGNPGRDAAGFKQGVIQPVRVVGVRDDLFYGQLLRAQPLMERLDDTRQQVLSRRSAKSAWIWLITPWPSSTAILQR